MSETLGLISEEEGARIRRMTLAREWARLVLIQDLRHEVDWDEEELQRRIIFNKADPL